GDPVDLAAERGQAEDDLGGVLCLPGRVAAEGRGQVGDITRLNVLLEELAAVGEEDGRRLVTGHRHRDLLLVRLAADPVDADVTAARIRLVELVDEVHDYLLRGRRLRDRPDRDGVAARSRRTAAAGGQAGRGDQGGP